MKSDLFLTRVAEISVYVFFACFPFSRALIEISSITAIVAWLLAKIIRREWPRGFADRTLIFLALFFVLSFASVFISQYSGQSIRGIIRAARQILFFLAVWDLFSEKKKLAGFMAVSFVLFLAMMFDGFYQMGAGKDLFRGWPVGYVSTNLRITGPFGDHGFWGAYLAVWGLLGLGFLFVRNSVTAREKIFLGLVSALSFFFIFHTQARTVWVSFAAGLAFLALTCGRKWVLLCLAVAAVAGVLILPRNMIIHEDAEKKEQSLVERFVLWDRAINVVKARPWLGTGINTYVKSYHEFDEEKSWRVQNYYAHNSYLQLAAERGLPALVFFLLFVSSFFVRAFRVLRSDEGPDLRAFLTGWTSGLVVFLVFSLADTCWESLQMGMFFWFFLGLGASALTITSKGRTLPT